MPQATAEILEETAKPKAIEVVEDEIEVPRQSTLPSDQSKWCHKALKKHLLLTRFESETEHDNQTFKCSVKATKVTTLVGDASLQVMAGTRRYVFDYSAFFDWEAEIRGHGDKFSLFFGGSCHLPDVASTVVDGVYDKELAQKRQCSKPNHAAALKVALDGFLADVDDRVAAFTDEYRDKVRIPLGLYGFQWERGVFDVQIRDKNVFFCPDFPGDCSWHLDGDDLSLVWGEVGTFKFREEFLGFWEGHRDTDKFDWRKLFFKRSLTPAETLTSGSAWNVNFERGRPFRVELRADGSFYCKDYPGAFTWQIADGQVQIDWGVYGKYDLDIDATNKILKGDKRGRPGDWRRLEFIEHIPAYCPPPDDRE